jgi:transcription initiation factor TFIIH subunit 2
MVASAPPGVLEEKARNKNTVERAAVTEGFSWDILEEDEHGRLRSSSHASLQRVRRQRLLSMASETAGQSIQRGMIRYLELVIDLSKAASINDMRPLRSVAMFGAAQDFIRSFFDENPLSQLGIVIMRDGVARQITELSSSPEMHIEKLKANLDTGGAASIGNALEVCTNVLRHIPPYGHREVLCILASLSTCDPGDVFKSIENAAKNKVRISAVGLAAEVHVFRKMCEGTGGKYGVALDQEHMENLVAAHATPPPSLLGQEEKYSLVHVGFPSQTSSAAGAACFVGKGCLLRSGAYICPRCKGKTLEVPSECHICGLTLIASPHLARSYHHLFPIMPFEEIRESVEKTCFGCQQTIGVSPICGAGTSETSRCTECLQYFCLDCDEYIHSHMHSCPGCECLT